MCCILSRTAPKGNPENVVPGRMKPIAWTQNTEVLLRLGTRTKTMKEGQAAQVFALLEKRSSANLHKRAILHQCSAPLALLEESFLFPLLPPRLLSHTNQSEVSITLSGKHLKYQKSSEASVLTSLQHIRALLHYKLQFLRKCLFKCNFPGNVKDNINNDHELG